MDNNQNDDIMTKIRRVSMESYEKTAKASKDAFKKIDEKYHDPVFQQDIGIFKDNVVLKSKVIAATTVQYSGKAYNATVRGVTSSWNFLSSKIREFQNKNNAQQSDVEVTKQESLREELLGANEKNQADQ